MTSRRLLYHVITAHILINNQNKRGMLETQKMLVGDCGVYLMIRSVKKAVRPYSSNLSVKNLGKRKVTAQQLR